MNNGSLLETTLRRQYFCRISNILILLCGLILQNTISYGQSNWKGWQLETSTNIGHITRHTPKLTIDNRQRVWGGEVNFNYQTWGKKNWNSWQRFPQLGCALIYFQLGERAHGYSMGMMPNLAIPVFRFKKTDFLFRLATGLVKISKPFDYQTNSTQNAIGSKWNNVTQFRFGGIWRADNGYFSGGAGGSFTHFSNGGSHRPNYGLNIPAFFLTTLWTPVALKKENFREASKPKSKIGHRWGGLFQAGLAISEIQVEDGPVHPVYSASIAAGYYLSEINRCLLGFDWELNTSIQYFLAHAGNQLDQSLSCNKASRWMVFIGDEFLFGNIGVQAQTGIYWGIKSELVPWVVYNKLAFRYYFPGLSTSGLKLWSGIYLKSHKITAEYISLSLGASI